MHRLKVNRVCRFRLKFLTKLKNVVINCAGAGISLIPPHFIEQSIARDHSFRVGNKKPKDFELHCGQTHGAIRSPYFHGHEIDAHSPKLHNVVFFQGMGLVQPSPHSFQEFLPGQRYEKKLAQRKRS